MNMKYDNDTLLERFAAAITENPQGSIEDHLETIGISKSSFYRIFGSKAGFEHKLKRKIQVTLRDIICTSGTNFDDSYEGLELIIKAHVSNKDIICLLCFNPSYLELNNENSYEHEINYWIPYKKALDAFFLKGQKKGDFKFNLTQAEVANHFLFTTAGVITAMKNGDIPANNIVDKIKRLFLSGVESKENEYVSIV